MFMVLHSSHIMNAPGIHALKSEALRFFTQLVGDTDKLHPNTLGEPGGGLLVTPAEKASLLSPQ